MLKRLTVATLEPVKYWIRGVNMVANVCHSPWRRLKTSRFHGSAWIARSWYNIKGWKLMRSHVKKGFQLALWNPWNTGLEVKTMFADLLWVTVAFRCLLSFCLSIGRRETVLTTIPWWNNHPSLPGSWSSSIIPYHQRIGHPLKIRYDGGPVPINIGVYPPFIHLRITVKGGEKSPHNVVGKGHGLCNIPVPDVSPVIALLTMAMPAPTWQLSGNRARISPLEGHNFTEHGQRNPVNRENRGPGGGNGENTMRGGALP